MRVTAHTPSFHPITITIENRDDFDQIIAILSGVADTKFNHAPQIVKAAQTLRSSLYLYEQTYHHE